MENQTQTSSVVVTDGSFKEDVLQSDLPVLVDFWAEWCGPCRAVGPTLEALAVKYQGKVKVAKLNVDENPEAARHFGVRSIPTLILFKDGDISQTTVGAQPKAQLIQMLDQNLA